MFVSGSHIEKRKVLLLRSTLCPYGGDGTAPYLKTLENIVLPANENFATFFQKLLFESWRCLFRALISKNGNYFCLDLHYVHKVEMGQRHTEKYSKNLLYPQMRIVQRFSKSTCMSHGGVCSRLSY